MLHSYGSDRRILGRFLFEGVEYSGACSSPVREQIRNILVHEEEGAVADGQLTRVITSARALIDGLQKAVE
jgi:hypothetical protein